MEKEGNVKMKKREEGAKAGLVAGAYQVEFAEVEVEIVIAAAVNPAVVEVEKRATGRGQGQERRWQLRRWGVEVAVLSFLCIHSATNKKEKARKK